MNEVKFFSIIRKVFKISLILSKNSLFLSLSIFSSNFSIFHGFRKFYSLEISFKFLSFFQYSLSLSLLELSWFNKFLIFSPSHQYYQTISLFSCQLFSIFLIWFYVCSWIKCFNQSKSFSHKYNQTKSKNSLTKFRPQHVTNGAIKEVMTKKKKMEKRLMKLKHVLNKLSHQKKNERILHPVVFSHC